MLKIEPLETQLFSLESELKKSETKKVQCERQLQELDVAVAELNAEFKRKISEAEALKVGLRKAEETLESAQSLLS